MAEAFQHTIGMRFRDTDCLGHVNNAVYLSYCEAARIQYFSKRLDLKFSKTRALPIILARVEIDFIAQGYLQSELTIEARIVHVGHKSFKQQYTIIGEDGILAQSTATLVWFDFADNQSVAIPDFYRSMLEEEKMDPRSHHRS